jgi:hypothetical protein
MNSSTIGTLEDLRAKLERAEHELDLATQRRNALRRMIEGAELLQKLDATEEPTAVEPPATFAEPDYKGSPRGFLRGREAILAVLARTGMEMEQRQIFREMERSSWVEPGLKDPFNSVRVTLRRMAKKGEIKKVRDGVYRAWIEGEPRTSESGSAAEQQRFEGVTS